MVTVLTRPGSRTSVPGDSTPAPEGSRGEAGRGWEVEMQKGRRASWSPALSCCTGLVVVSGVSDLLWKPEMLGEPQPCEAGPGVLAYSLAAEAHVGPTQPLLVPNRFVLPEPPMPTGRPTPLGSGCGSTFCPYASTCAGHFVGTGSRSCSLPSSLVFPRFIRTDPGFRHFSFSGMDNIPACT